MATHTETQVKELQDCPLSPDQLATTLQVGDAELKLFNSIT